MSVRWECPNAACRRAGTALDSVAAPRHCPDCGTRLTSDEAPPSPGRAATAAAVISRYQLRRELGAGAFGAVYQAYDPQLDRDIAIKVLRSDLMSSGEAVERFQREARATAKLLHPNIVPVFDAGSYAGSDGVKYFIASAFIAGKPLSQLIPDKGLPPTQAVRLELQLLDALAYAHERGVVHRDVKPANMMVDGKQQLFLMDFGLAGWLEEGASRLTRDGDVMGTPCYMSPEQASGERDKIGPASDQYSAGVVLYHLLTGQPPFSGQVATVIYAVLHRPPPAPSSLRPGIDAELERICLKAMAKQPGQRFKSCTAMAAALQQWLARQSDRGTEPIAPIGGVPPHQDTLKPTDDVGTMVDSRVPKRPPSPHDPEHSKIGAAVVLLIFLVFGGMMLLALLLAFPRDEGEAKATQGVAAPSSTAAAPEPTRGATLTPTRAAPPHPTSAAPPATNHAPPTAATRPAATEVARLDVNRPRPSLPRRVDPVATAPTAATRPADDGRSLLQREMNECLDLVMRGKNVRAFLQSQSPKRLAAWRQAAREQQAPASWLLGQCALHGVSMPLDLQQALGHFRDAADLRLRAAQPWVAWLSLRLASSEAERQLALHMLREQADAKNPHACLFLAETYLDGKILERDPRTAVPLLQTAAQAGHALAQNMLGIRYFTGDGVARKDPATAVFWWRKAANSGCPAAQFNLGRAHALGQGVSDVDLAEAASWYRQAAEQGHVLAMYHLAQALEAGAGFQEPDPRQAFAWYQRAASAGHVDAQHQVGVWLKTGGRGVTANPKEAVGWLRQAAEKNHTEAQIELGQCYESGLGLPDKDPRQAAIWYRKAAAAGDARAQFRYGMLLRSGALGKRDLESAMTWLRKAAEHGLPEAANALGECLLESTPNPTVEQKEEAVRWFRSAADQGQSSAQFNLGRCYERGWGVSKNLDTARSWYAKAMRQGHAAARAAWERVSKP